MCTDDVESGAGRRLAVLVGQRAVVLAGVLRSYLVDQQRVVVVLGDQLPARTLRQTLAVLPSHAQWGTGKKRKA